MSRASAGTHSRLEPGVKRGSLPAMRITAIVENDIIKLPAESGNALAGLAPFVGKITTLPPDFAERHDEYIHGRKRSL